MTEETKEQETTKARESYDAPEGLNFTLAVKVIPVKLQDPVSKKVYNYTLEEMDGKERDSYLQSLSDKMKIGKAGENRGLRTYMGLQANLISRCLYDERHDLIPVNMVQTYPASVQSALFKKAQEICGLNDDAEDDAKND